MTRVLFAVLLIAHGLVHVPIWLAPRELAGQGPFDPAHSWLLDRAPGSSARSSSASRALALAAAASFASAGWLLALDHDTWRAAALLGCELGLVLKLAWFSRWLLAGIALDAAVLVLAIGV